jgi:hypothetical protein
VGWGYVLRNHITKNKDRATIFKPFEALNVLLPERTEIKRYLSAVR